MIRLTAFSLVLTTQSISLEPLWAKSATALMHRKYALNTPLVIVYAAVYM